jgi:RimJ/RimL family protein N-acetyltransferase
MEDFFQNGIGVALIVNNEIVGFCLSEYSLEDSLGANIWIDDKFQGFGYAKKLTNAFLLCCQRNDKNVYWVCDNDNVRSNKVAQSTKFVFDTSDHYFEL